MGDRGWLDTSCKDCMCASTVIVCASEGETCSCNGFVQYGRGSEWTQPRRVTGSMSCTGPGPQLHQSRTHSSYLSGQLVDGRPQSQKPDVVTFADPGFDKDPWPGVWSRQVLRVRYRAGTRSDS